MRVVFSLYFILFFGLHCFAKSDSAHVNKDYKNTVMLSISNFSILGITPFDHLMFTGYISNQLGINVAHKLNNSIRILAGYNEWNLHPFFDKIIYDPVPYTSFLYYRQYIKGSRSINEPGALRHRYGYKMIDLSATYRYDKFRRHKFTGGVGASYTWGTNYYLIRRVFSTNLNSYQYFTQKETKSYIGLILPVRYDLLFLHNRLSFGVQGTARKYIGLQSLQIDYGFHLSANF